MLTEDAYGGIIDYHWIDGMKNRLYGQIGEGNNMAVHTLKLSKNQSKEHYHEINSHWMLTIVD